MPKQVMLGLQFSDWESGNVSQVFGPYTKVRTEGTLLKVQREADPKPETLAVLSTERYHNWHLTALADAHLPPHPGFHYQNVCYDTFEVVPFPPQRKRRARVKV